MIDKSTALPWRPEHQALLSRARGDFQRKQSGKVVPLRSGDGGPWVGLTARTANELRIGGALQGHDPDPLRLPVDNVSFPRTGNSSDPSCCKCLPLRCRERETKRAANTTSAGQPSATLTRAAMRYEMASVTPHQSHPRPHLACIKEGQAEFTLHPMCQESQ
ncbi:hypothetical protein SKAU_G00199170 [Synaphobranchus kaupii]|uniref:Uncharacterized protein n=1 Tax=Synaphobranchus kaupii TaxID=118154 RepID=A0A9Q1FF17_SYNKA|nr:hypothetical protein SKAU_G00199170 [Synaphobranchus kaupii]